MSFSREKQQLIEEIGIRLESRLSLAPLAARIYSVLALSSRDGLTFEEIREAIGASKSSTSVNLKTLMQLKYIDYYTKSGNRKRYFRITTHFQLSVLRLDYVTLENDIGLVDKINAYNKVHHPEKFENEKYIGEITIGYLKEMQNLVQKSIAEIEKQQSGD